MATYAETLWWRTQTVSIERINAERAIRARYSGIAASASTASIDADLAFYCARRDLIVTDRSDPVAIDGSTFYVWALVDPWLERFGVWRSLRTPNPMQALGSPWSASLGYDYALGLTAYRATYLGGSIADATTYRSTILADSYARLFRDFALTHLATTKPTAVPLGWYEIVVAVRTHPGLQMYPA
jgi:hypothetical protein